MAAGGPTGKKVRPIKPREVVSKVKKKIPDEVIEAINELIVENYEGGKVIIKQKDVVARIIEKGLNENDIYKKGWLDVEDAYGSIGWCVTNKIPEPHDTYDAFFEFKEKSR